MLTTWHVRCLCWDLDNDLILCKSICFKRLGPDSVADDKTESGTRLDFIGYIQTSTWFCLLVCNRVWAHKVELRQIALQRMRSLLRWDPKKRKADQTLHMSCRLNTQRRCWWLTWLAQLVCESAGNNYFVSFGIIFRLVSLCIWSIFIFVSFVFCFNSFFLIPLHWIISYFYLY